MILRGSVLSEDEVKKIHNDSVRILEEVGVKFPSERALGLLEKNGARVDWDRDIAYISQSMIKDALEKAPKAFTLGARNPKYDLKLPASDTVYNLDGCGVYTYDYSTGKRRESRLRDIEEAARIFDQIDIGNVIWSPVAAGDVPAGSRSLIEAAVCLKNCGKHIQDEVKDAREVDFVIHILKALLGDVEEIRRRKIYSVTYCTIAPLSHDREMLEATMDLSRYHVPVLAYPMPATGSTGPASLYSNVAMANAENLSTLVLFQLENPGTPIIYGAALGTINRVSGMFLEGAAETVLQITAMKEMGDSYKLPTMTAGCLTDAKTPGMQAVMEKMATSWPLVMAGADVIQGIGLLETSMTLSLEQMVIDEEIAMINKRLKAGVQVNSERDFIEDIKRVGPGGHFLGQKNTRSAFRSDEYYEPMLADRGSYRQWIDMGSPDMLQTAHKRVEQMLASEPENPLPGSVTKEIDEILEEAKAVLK